jgi:hypothetical protein
LRRGEGRSWQQQPPAGGDDVLAVAVRQRFIDDEGLAAVVPPVGKRSASGSPLQVATTSPATGTSWAMMAWMVGKRVSRSTASWAASDTA